MRAYMILARIICATIDVSLCKGVHVDVESDRSNLHAYTYEYIQYFWIIWHVISVDDVLTNEENTQLRLIK